MLFTSIEFLLFFPLVTLIYYLIPARRRWLFLLAASYLFFMSWVPEYVVLILTSTIVAYVTAIKIENEENQTLRRRFLWISIVTNVGMLFVFKYFNFLNGNVRALFEALGASYPIADLNTLAPIGISFYTLMVLGYSIDVYQRRTKAERNPGIFALFVSFFPQLAAGPIERGRNMLPQFHSSHSFEYERVITGLVRIAWGFFKKLVVADRLALLVNTVYGSPTLYTGNPLILATYAFAFQIYCDFSAYSDIAIGAAQILGFNLMENFKQPYFSKSVSDFWRNWHISLSTWLRDYIFFPLRRSMLKNRLANAGNLAALIIPPIITMLVSGLWHGADWTFVIWGALHGVLILLDTIWNQYFKNWTGFNRLPDNLKTGLQIFLTFHIISITWIFFRANSLSDAFYILQNLLVNVRLQSTGLAWIMPGGKYQLLIALCAVTLVVLIDLLQARKVGLRTFALRLPVWFRWAAYYALILIILMFGKFGVGEFIYVQF